MTWYATRYRSLMFPGDIVFFWLGGSQKIKGIYGWGRLTSSPYSKPEWKSSGVDVKYEIRLKPHVSIGKIRSVPDLENLLILHAPQATNFLLSTQEAQAIINLIDISKRPKVI